MSSPRSALALVVGGLLLDLADVRVAQFDVLPDVVGLALVVIGLGELSAHLPGLRRARQVAVVAAVLSLADAVHPLRSTTEVVGAMTTTTTAASAPTGLWGVASGLHEVAVALVLVVLCRAVARAAQDGGHATVAAVFGRLVVWNAVLLGVLVLTTAAVPVLGDEVTDLWAVLVPLAVVGIALRLWTLARLWGLREGPPLARTASATERVGGSGAEQDRGLGERLG